MNTALLLSGGIDSISLAYLMKPDIAVTIDYGQRVAHAEIKASRTFCSKVDIQHEVISIDCSSLGSGDLSDVPAIDAAPVPEWWPYRNQLLVTLACMKLISYGINELWVGSVKTDSCHTDGTKLFYDKLDDLVQFQEGNIIIKAPAIEMDTVSLVRKSQIPLSLLAWSHSCHKANFACGSCRGCFKHQSVMSELGNGSY